MDLLKAMEVFVAVVENGSLISASITLNTSNAAVSRQLAGLEDHLGTRLLNRTTRRVWMTDAGEDFFRRAQQILSDVAEAEGRAGINTLEPKGVLRISAPLSFGISRLGRWLPDFVKRYPDLQLDLDLTDRMVDLAAEGIDVAVRITRQPASANVIVRKIAPIAMPVCAAPSYLKRKGRPSHPTELVNHDTMASPYMSSGDTWDLVDAQGGRSSVRIRPFIHSTNGDILREFMLAGLGVAIGPAFIVERDIAQGSIVPILEDWKIDGYNLYALYLTRKFLPAKVRVFIDYLTAMEGNVQL
ncbi:LysR family transcriptional regulator [Mesorhizobium sp. NZP2077]|uniref:LysR family transcriptional regulator n=1 Tax=Mesorhizobium sp. NZP2077 TaxID=2483404 RepID=UPI0015577189|nr:LysR family transcriptional regulator [Mesorhizobium sp. NZP2077]QKC85416.1 LysR family transcriptional regulator [Mesorhizobium sp. NZP2077]QKD19056.1 LysR family transcriptional regulator [Mesorhizobium sp. NZP2077]